MSIKITEVSVKHQTEIEGGFFSIEQALQSIIDGGMFEDDDLTMAQQPLLFKDEADERVVGILAYYMEPKKTPEGLGAGYEMQAYFGRVDQPGLIRKFKRVIEGEGYKTVEVK